MNHHFLRTAKVLEIAIACSLCLSSPDSFAQQQLNLGPLPGVGQLPEYLVPGTGQGFLGLATFYMGLPVIFYDNVWVQRIGGVGSPGFRFLRAHEYAHHVRGHELLRLNSPPQMWPVLGYQEELDADCTAVSYLRRIGDPAAVDAGARLYRALLPPQDIGGRPGATARLHQMTRC